MGLAISTLPMTKGSEADAKRGGKLSLRHADLRTDCFHIHCFEVMNQRVGPHSRSMINCFLKPSLDAVKCLTHFSPRCVYKTFDELAECDALGH